MNLIATDKKIVIFGLGKTGVSVARYLVKSGRAFSIVDSRENPPGISELRKFAPDAHVIAGPLDKSLENYFSEAAEIIISPGLPRTLPVLQKAMANNVPLVGDIALFLREVKAPVIGITGSNGKTTVTTLMGKIAAQAGINVAVAGNIGLPALDALDATVELYVLELSSFQLESIASANLSVACVLNISEDHMDRYDSLSQYYMAKQRIFWGAKKVVYNLDDQLTQPPVVSGVGRYGFGLHSKAEDGEQKYLWDRRTKALVCNGNALLTSSELKMFGVHNIANALAVFALCDAAKISRDAVVAILREFTGLTHRCQWVAEHSGVTYINDSKATNVGAAIAAISGVAEEFKTITLIAGGDGKDADFCELANAINEHVTRLIYIGRDGPRIATLVDDAVEKKFASSMNEAVIFASQSSLCGNLVLLSPACASFDMFKGYEDRGEHFIRAVGALTQ